MPKTRWHRERIARLSFLIGLGWDAKRIAEDPSISSTPSIVYDHARRLGLAFRHALPNLAIELPPQAIAVYDDEARRLGYTREGLIKQLLVAAAVEPVLIRNIIDEQR